MIHPDECRLRHDAVLGRLASYAFSGATLEAVVHETASLLMESLEVELIKVARLAPDGERLELIEGLGFAPESIGAVTLPATRASLAGFTLEMNEVVLIEDLTKDDRFVASEMLIANGVRSGVCCVIPGPPGGRPFGVLGVLAQSPHRFGRQDAPFVESMTRLLGAAIQHLRLATRVRELEEADARRNELLALLGHELRDPLAAISNGVQVLAQVERADPKLPPTRAMFERQSHHMASLVDGLLEAARVAQGKLSIEPRPMELGVTLGEVAADRLPKFEARGLRLEFFSPPSPLFVTADPVRLAQVFDNLLGNALKFTDRGGAVFLAARATPVGKDERRWAEVSVRDTGVGLDPAMRDSLFEPFRQDPRHRTRSEGGLGLGLALSKGLIELHGGEIECRSEGPGQGTELLVRLPLVEPSDDQVAAAGASEPPVPNGRALKALDILLIEDNQDAAEMLRDVLDFAGHRVAIALSGREGLARLRSTPPQVVLCDLELPDMNGCDIARALRSLPSPFESTLLVALSGHGDPSTRMAVAAAGFDAHLLKPASLEDIEAALAKLLKV